MVFGLTGSGRVFAWDIVVKLRQVNNVIKHIELFVGYWL